MRLQPVLREPNLTTADVGGMAAQARQASEFLKALAHEGRLTILCILCEGERSVTELERMLALRQPTVSQQLARLRADGLVSARRDGKTIHYSVVREDVRTMITAVHDIFDAGRAIV